MQTSKQSCSRELFEIDWVNFYNRFSLDPNVDIITSSIWTLSDGSAGPDFINSTKTSIFIEGGTAGTTLVAENTIEINSGEYKDCRKIYIEVN